MSLTVAEELKNNVVAWSFAMKSPYLVLFLVAITTPLDAGTIPGPDREPGPIDISFFVDSTRVNELDREQTNTYGLSMTVPWESGGSLFINFPEHLEYGPQGNTILRHHDPRPIPWIISPDGRQASYRVESEVAPGVIVEAFARTAREDEYPTGTKGVYVAMRISNGGDADLSSVRPLLCLQYRKVAGFPTWFDNFDHNYVSIGGRLTALSDLPTEAPDTKFKGAVVAGCPQRDTRAERRGGLIGQDMDLAASVVSSMDGRRKILIWWTPGKSMIANANIPCIHADPYFGTIAAGESAYAEGMILFTEQDAETVVRELRRKDRTNFGTMDAGTPAGSRTSK